MTSINMPDKLKTIFVVASFLKKKKKYIYIYIYVCIHIHTHCCTIQNVIDIFVSQKKFTLFSFSYFKKKHYFHLSP